MVKSDKIIFSSLAVGALLAFLFYTPKVTYGHRVVAPHEPIQKLLKEGEREPMQINGYTIYSLADYTIEARILSTRNYHFGKESELSPIDLGVGWGPMSDEELLDKLTFSQHDRFMFWNFKERINTNEVIRHASNMHIIPATDDILDALRSLHVGQVVKLSGRLVGAEAYGWFWRSSLTRDDTGRGACELMYVEKAEIEEIN